MIAAAQSSSLVRQDILPAAVGYVLIMGALAAGLLLRRRQGDEGARVPPTAPGRPGWPRLIRHWITTAVGGYLLLMAILIAYFFGVVHVGGNFIESAGQADQHPAS